MKQTIKSILSAVFVGFLSAGCAQQTSYLEVSKMLNEMPMAESLAKVVYKNSDSYNYSCTAASIGNGLFLTSSGCTGRNNWVYALDKTRHEAEIIKQGIVYSEGQDIINDPDANWAILYAPGLRLPPLTLSSVNMTEGSEYCIAYFENEYFWSRSYRAQNINPTQVCGKTSGRNHLHREISWGGAFKKQNGFWGAPILNSENHIVGIISYKYTNDFQRSGVLELDSFSDAVKETVK